MATCQTRAVLCWPTGQNVYPLKIGINTVGRFSGNDVSLLDRHISRRHCVIFIHAIGQGELYDTASVNGTFLNDQSLREEGRPLVSGDQIYLAER